VTGESGPSIGDAGRGASGDIMTTDLASAVALEPTQVDLEPVANEFSGPRTSAAASPSTASSGIEISSLSGSAARVEPPGPRPSGSRPSAASRGMVTTRTSSTGFIRMQIRTSRPPRPRLGPATRRLPLTTLVVTVVRSARINGSPRLKLVAYIGSIRVDEANVPAARRRFWDRAAERLEQFTPEAREKFEQRISAKIPRPPAELAAARLAKAIEEARARSRARLAAMRAEPVADTLFR
jgi:hypothetical protein